MDIKFSFRHENLSIVDLHKIGIRTTKRLEEVILDIMALVVVFTFDANMNIVTEEAKRATIDEIK